MPFCPRSAQRSNANYARYGDSFGLVLVDKFGSARSCRTRFYSNPPTIDWKAVLTV